MPGVKYCKKRLSILGQPLTKVIANSTTNLQSTFSNIYLLTALINFPEKTEPLILIE